MLSQRQKKNPDLMVRKYFPSSVNQPQHINKPCNPQHLKRYHPRNRHRQTDITTSPFIHCRQKQVNPINAQQKKPWRHTHATNRTLLRKFLYPRQSIPVPKVHVSTPDDHSTTAHAGLLLTPRVPLSYLDDGRSCQLPAQSPQS